MPRINRITQILIALFVPFVMALLASAIYCLSETQAENLPNTLDALQKKINL